MFCKCSAIKTYLGVRAEIVSNELNINDVGIEVVNNASKLVDNTIEKSHENGIQIKGDNPDTRSKPLLYKNRIISCGFNGIICTGFQCEPDIRGNLIQSNRKAGIKLNEGAKANIGGTCKEDLTEEDPDDFMSESQTTKQAPMLFQSTATLGEPKQQEKLFDPKKMLKRNTIASNYNQGILVVEGSYAVIQSNAFEKNIKASIALGGKNSGQTKIRWNSIENSKAEGIFVVEGEERLLIEENKIRGNLDGIVMVNSRGVVRKNQI